jgi:hypothetical protein
MADEENNTETTATTGEPKPAEMSANVTKKATPKKKAPAKKAPAKKAAVEKVAPVAAAPAATKATPAAARRSYTPPARSMWWQALIFIAIVVYAFSLIRHAAKGPQAEASSATEIPPVATEAAAPQVLPPPQMMPMPAMPPMPHMNLGSNNGPATGSSANGRDMGNMGSGYNGRDMGNMGNMGNGNMGTMPAAPALQQMAPNAAPQMPQGQQMQPMPPRPYGMPAYPYPPQGYGFYGPGGWYGPGYPMPYPTQPMPNN